MNAVYTALRRLAELALLVALVLFVVFAIRTVAEPGGADQTLQQSGEAALTPEIAAGTPYVAPYQDVSQPTPVGDPARHARADRYPLGARRIDGISRTAARSDLHSIP